MFTTTAMSFGQWFSDASYELVQYFDHLNSTEWAILSACAVTFGFVCLKGQSLRH